MKKAALMTNAEIVAELIDASSGKQEIKSFNVKCVLRTICKLLKSSGAMTIGDATQHWTVSMVATYLDDMYVERKSRNYDLLTAIRL